MDAVQERQDEEVAAILAERRYRISVAEYDAMIAAGIFGNGDPIELIEGELIVMSPIGDTHVRAVIRLNSLFAHLIVDKKALVSTQNPIRLARSEPQPDFVLIPYTANYRDGLPTPKTILVVIEVSDSTLQYDRTVKTSIYARAGIVEYWIVDTNALTITQFWKPENRKYQQSRTYSGKETLTGISIPELSFVVGEIF